ncbi:bifunctional adenosylcobinamide kinase/adenosylcobinamide-phosphate guanylyltransferase [Anaerobacillus sp. MEB173]|uniref:bifunctional adenosylcobinamide kinase/adenosylcobinamide-phosphate guanylyltransferase n=1 Tax=Anaerobacillus sp. MEB173 TaxID=3383345 RepID=UPI003F9169EE
MIAFITGGVRSGKSSYAEQLAINCAREDQQLYYIATSIPEDEEMQKRVNHHKNDRNRSGANWQTIEQARNVVELLDRFQTGDVVLLDCLTNLLSNELFFDWDKDNPSWQNENFHQHIKEKILSFVIMCKQKEITTIIVSNELLQSPIPNDQGTFYYMKLLGDLHQEIVSLADTAMLVDYGIVREMKN